MAEIILTSAPDAVFDPLKAATEVAVKEIDLNLSSNDSDASSTADAIAETGSVVMLNNDLEFSTKRVRDSFFTEGRVVSRTIRHTSRSFASETISRAENNFVALIDFITNATREASSLKEFWSGITEEYYETINEREDLYQRAIELGKQCDTYKEGKLRLDRDLAEKLRMVQKLNKSLLDARQSEARERRRYQESDEENKRLRQQMHDAGHKLTHIENERNNLLIELSTIRARIRVVEEERDSSRKQYDELDIEYHRVTQQRDELLTQVDELTAQYQLSQHEVMKLTEKLDISERQRQDLSESCSKLTVEIDRVKAELATSSTLIIEWTNKYTRCRAEADKHLISIGDLEKEKNELSRNFGLVVRERDLLRVQQTEHVRIVEQLKRESASLQKQLEISEEEQRSTLSKNERLRAQLRESNSKRQTMLDELNKVKRECSDARSHVARVDEEIVKQKTTIVSLQNEKVVLIERATNAENDANEQRRKCNESVSDLNKLTEKLTELEQDIERVSEERDRLNMDLEKALTGCSGHAALVIELRERIRLLEDRCSNLDQNHREVLIELDVVRRERDASDLSRDLNHIKWTEKCKQVERMLRDGVYCPCEHVGGGGSVTKPSPMPPTGQPVNGPGKPGDQPVPPKTDDNKCPPVTTNPPSKGCPPVTTNPPTNGCPPTKLRPLRPDGIWKITWLGALIGYWIVRNGRGTKRLLKNRECSVQSIEADEETYEPLPEDFKLPDADYDEDQELEWSAAGSDVDDGDVAVCGGTGQNDFEGDNSDGGDNTDEEEEEEKEEDEEIDHEDQVICMPNPDAEDVGTVDHEDQVICMPNSDAEEDSFVDDQFAMSG